MGNILFKKLLKKMDFAPVLKGILRSVGGSIVIEDADGSVLLTGFDGAGQNNRYPVTAAGETIGWVRGSEKVLAIASLLSYVAERELEKRNLVRETLNKYKEITLLYEMAEKIAACLDPKEVARLAIDEVKRVIRADNISLMLLSEETGKLEVILSSGKEFETSEFMERFCGDGIAGSVMATGKAEIVNDVESDPRYVLGPKMLSSLMCSPLRTKEKVIGVMRVSTEQPVTYTAEDLKLFTTLSSQAAVAIENARLYDSLRETFITSIRTLAETIEKRDPYTGGHTKRVMEYSLAIGRVLGISEGDMTRLELASVLHDIGKIGVSDNVLLKPGKLNDEEFAEIRKHPGYGEEILGHIVQLRNVIPGVKCHHERYDGRGYPDGLAGQEIDITARIISVADSFDAMTTNRPYRQGLSLEQAFGELQRFSGTQFDPEVVNAFLAADVMEVFFNAAARKTILS